MLAIVLLPPLILFWLLARQRGADWRSAVLLAAVGWGLMVLLITEGLSLWHLLTRLNVAAAWIVLTLVLLLVHLRLAPATPPTSPDPRPRLPLLSWIALTLFAPIPLTLLVIAILVPPTTFDSLSYHMPRVMYWMQHQSVAPYPTHIVRQVQQCPLAEYGILHFMLLTGEDRLANLPQYLAMLASLVAVSLIARSLGARPRGQAFAVIVCGTIPMGMLQATTTQNDYVAACWLVCAIALLLDALRREKFSWPLALTGGVATGLALFTKGTAYIYVAPLLGAVAVLLLFRWHGRGAAAFVAITSTALVLNLPHYLRNWQLTSLPLGPTTETWDGATYSYANPELSVSATLTNLLRNTALQLETPWPKWNQRLEQAARGAMATLGLDPDDAKTMWMGRSFHLPTGAWGREDIAPNPLHVALAILGGACAVFAGKAHRWWASGYAVLLLAMLLAFSAYLRWQPWHCRLMLGIAVASTPLIGLVADRVWRGPVLYLLAAALILAATPCVLYSDSRPLLGDGSVLFTDRAALRLGSSQFTQYHRTRLALQVQRVRSSGVRDIGLVVGGNDREYPLWAAMRDAGLHVRFQHVNVNNYTSPLSEIEPYRSFRPQAIIRRDVHDPRW